VQIVVTGRHVEITDEMKDYVQAKVERLPRYYDRIHEVEVVFDQASEQFTAEMICRAGHRHTFVATETGPDPLALVDLVTDKVEKQLRKQKEKEKSHGHRDARSDTAG